MGYGQESPSADKTFLFSTDCKILSARSQQRLSRQSALPKPFQQEAAIFAMSRLIRSFTDLRARNNAGEDVDFGAFADKVVLVVNVARH